MKNFLLDNDGDVVIENGRIQMTSGADLTAQTFRQVIATKLGEWEYNPGEGMDFSVLLTKNYNVDLIRDAIESAAKQVDEDAEITDFSFERQGRDAEISFYIKTEGQEIYISL